MLLASMELALALLLVVLSLAASAAMIVKSANTGVTTRLCLGCRLRLHRLRPAPDIRSRYFSVCS